MSGPSGDPNASMSLSWESKRLCAAHDGSPNACVQPRLETCGLCVALFGLPWSLKAILQVALLAGKQHAIVLLHRYLGSGAAAHDRTDTLPPA